MKFDNPVGIRTVLIVDPDEDFRMLLSKKIQMPSAIEEASSFQTAWTKIRF